MPVLHATFRDIPTLVALINSAYRGEGSKQGWTTEADLIKGELRTDEPALLELMEADDSAFLKYLNEQGEIEGCVFIQKISDRMYLGMLSVSPTQQAKGIGKQLMTEAQIHAKKWGCDRIFMRVVSIRHELINWYNKQGYYKTNQTEPFPRDTRFGVPAQPLEFMIMEKMIT
ncbi:MAG TPA: GNAT family N-acetyltransferase [Chitinophagaceae bacterium]|nr:GNAT family N-acetyltransferase [Chitinophagaceae bacterium]